MSAVEIHEGVDREAVLRAVGINARDPNAQALLLVCERYGLDPLLKHMVLISSRPYITRDGYLHIAHSSGQLDGIEVLEEGEDETHWWARVAVYRKDMSKPFAYKGRYPKSGHQKLYGPEMAIKCGEVMALRRAFDVTGVGAADERWDDPSDVVQFAEPATDADYDAIELAVAGLTEDQHAELSAWCKENGIPPRRRRSLTAEQADAVLDHITWMALPADDSGESPGSPDGESSPVVTAGDDSLPLGGEG